METWTKREFEEQGLFYDSVQDNHSSSSVKGTLRGLHFQRGEKAQARLARCVRKAPPDAGGFARLSEREEALARMLGKVIEGVNTGGRTTACFRHS